MNQVRQQLWSQHLLLSRCRWLLKQKQKIQKRSGIENVLTLYHWASANQLQIQGQVREWDCEIRPNVIFPFPHWQKFMFGNGIPISIHTLLSDYLSMPREVNLCLLISDNKGPWKPWKDSLHQFILRWATWWGLAHLVWLFAPSERLWWTGCRSGEIVLGRPSPEGHPQIPWPMT